MRMPGFTAETSLETSAKSYQMVTNLYAQSDSRKVLPQDKSCIVVCNKRGCSLHCVENVPQGGPIVA